MHNNTQFLYPMGFIDGALQRSSRASGLWIAISAELSYRIFWNGGCGTNNKVEAIALWGLLWFSNFLNIPYLHIYRDLKIIIDQVLGKAAINTPMLQGSLKRIELLWQLHEGSIIQHTHKSQNKEVDRLSKKGLLGMSGKWYLEITWEHNTYDMGEFLFPS